MDMSLLPEMQSKYLKASDVTHDQSLIVDRVVMESMKSDKGEETKPVLYFQQRQKGLILRVTNLSTMIASYGKESDAWTGRPVELFIVQTNFQGGAPGIRLRIPMPQPETAAAPAQPIQPPAPPAPVPEPPEEDIPF